MQEWEKQRAWRRVVEAWSRRKRGEGKNGGRKLKRNSKATTFSNHETCKQRDRALSTTSSVAAGRGEDGTRSRAQSISNNATIPTSSEAAAAAAATVQQGAAVSHTNGVSHGVGDESPSSVLSPITIMHYQLDGVSTQDIHDGHAAGYGGGMGERSDDDASHMQQQHSPDPVSVLSPFVPDVLSGPGGGGRRRRGRGRGLEEEGTEEDGDDSSRAASGSPEPRSSLNRPHLVSHASPLSRDGGGPVHLNNDRDSDSEEPDTHHMFARKNMHSPSL